MDSDTKTDSCCNTKASRSMPQGSSGAVYGLGLIGAAVYYIQQAPTFTAGVVGLLKALVWPAFLVYYALTSFGL